MSLINEYSVKAFDHYYFLKNSSDYFILSDINSRFMKRNSFSGTIKDFKEKVRKSKPYTKVVTGGTRYPMRRTPLYRISDFK